MYHNSIEILLKDHGYDIKDNICTSSVCKYIKCLSSTGNNVFVLLDEKGTVSKSESDYTYFEKLDDSVRHRSSVENRDLIDYDLRTGFYNAVGTSVAGVGIESDKGVTFIITGNSQYPTTTNYIRKEGDSSIRQSNITKSPVVRMSEILSHSQVIEDAIKRRSKSIMNIQYF